MNVHASNKSLKLLKVYYQRTDMHLKSNLSMTRNAAAKVFKKTARKKDAKRSKERGIGMFTLAYCHNTVFTEHAWQHRLEFLLLFSKY